MDPPSTDGRKALLSLATTAGAGLKEVQEYLEKVAIQWGMQPTARIGRSVIDRSPLSQTEVQNFVKHLYEPTNTYTPSYKQVLQYQVQKALALNVLPIDRKYWISRGLDKKHYYYPCHISFGKRFIAWVLYQILRYKIRTETASK